jgi:hypothetical protein
MWNIEDPSMLKNSKSNGDFSMNEKFSNWMLQQFNHSKPGYAPKKSLYMYAMVSLNFFTQKYIE